MAPTLDRTLAETAVAEGTRRYFAERRERVGPFIDRHFSLPGTLRLHRKAVGWDIAKAPLNLSLAAPQIGLKLGAMAARRLGAAGAAKFMGRSILLETAVSRELAWLLHTELLELPFQQGDRVATRDALAETILATPRVEEALVEALAVIGHHGDDPAFRTRLDEALSEYATSRAAAAEITTGLLSLGAGAAAMGKLTPGAASLGPSLAAMFAQQAAVSSFPLGGWLGAAWYGLFPAAPAAGMVAGTTGGLMLGASVFAAFAGVVSDPVQRALGLHRARLMRMLGVLEKQFFDPATPGFAVHDHYVARLLDLFDIVGAALRLARV